MPGAELQTSSQYPQVPTQFHESATVFVPRKLYNFITSVLGGYDVYQAHFKKLRHEKKVTDQS